MSLAIRRVPMTRPHYTRGRIVPIRALVMHATAGSAPGDFAWLQRGGSDRAPISAHYYIAPDGTITQFVEDGDTAWHAGASAWRGLEVNGSLNACSIGIELSHSNRPTDPHDPRQVAAAIDLASLLVQRYGIPQEHLVRHLDISPGRKTDPAALDWPAFVQAVYGRAMTYTEHSEILGIPPSSAGPDQIAERIIPRALSGCYTPADIRYLINIYWQRSEALGIDPMVPIAQMCHETGYLTSFWSQRPQRNPAGIGVTGEHSRMPTEGYVYNPQRGRYERGLSFSSWAEEAIPAHLGRLLAYALPADTGSPEQRLAIDLALAIRPLPSHCRGSAPTLRALGAAHNRSGCGWAAPGAEYGARIAAVANLLVA